MKKLVLALLFIGMSISPVFAARDVFLTWQAPTTNTDGSPVTDLAGYEVQYGNATGVYDVAVDVGNVLTHTLNLDDGDWYFVIRSVDTSGNWSGFSNECNKKIDSVATIPPGNLSCDF